MAAFVRANTAVAAPPMVPEIRLHLASEITPIWHATEDVLAQVGVPPPYWAFCWPGGQALARFILDRPERLKGRRVLDFAAGCGIAAIAAARTGASVEASDIDAMAVVAMRINAALNGVRLAASACDLAGVNDGRWDAVLAGDVFYERPFAERIWPWFQALAAAGVDVLVADPGRAYLPATGMLRLITYAVPTTTELEDRDVRETSVWQVIAPVAARRR